MIRVEGWREPKKLWTDTKDLYKRLVKALNFVVDLIIAESLEVRMTPGVRGWGDGQ